MPFDFAHPLALALLPLALLPLLRRRKDTLAFSYLAWLPPDRCGRVMGWLWRAMAVLAMASIVIGLASPGRSGAQLERSGHGAEALILLDRSSSMDAVIQPNIIRKALVGDMRWRDKAMLFFITAVASFQIEYFRPEQEDFARAWLNA